MTVTAKGVLARLRGAGLLPRRSLGQHFLHLTNPDVLTGRFSGPNGPEHVFRRASQDAIAWWSGVRPRVEAEEVRSGGR